MYLGKDRSKYRDSLLYGILFFLFVDICLAAGFIKLNSTMGLLLANLLMAAAAYSIYISGPYIELSSRLSFVIGIACYGSFLLTLIFSEGYFT